jgi:hypothetical protein
MSQAFSSARSGKRADEDDNLRGVGSSRKRQANPPVDRDLGVPRHASLRAGVLESAWREAAFKACAVAGGVNTPERTKPRRGSAIWRPSPAARGEHGSAGCSNP